MGDTGKGLPIHKRKQKLWSMPCGKDAHNAPDQQPHLLKLTYRTGSEVQAQSQIPPQQLQMIHQTEGERGGGGKGNHEKTLGGGARKNRRKTTKKTWNQKGYKKKKDENHILRPEEKDWEPQNHDVTTTSAKTKMKKFQKSIPTEDARPGRNDRLGQDLNPGTYGYVW